VKHVQFSSEKPYDIRKILVVMSDVNEQSVTTQSDQSGERKVEESGNLKISSHASE
jgi:hypothetical protein